MNKKFVIRLISVFSLACFIVNSGMPAGYAFSNEHKIIPRLRTDNGIVREQKDESQKSRPLAKNEPLSEDFEGPLWIVADSRAPVKIEVVEKPGTEDLWVKAQLYDENRKSEIGDPIYFEIDEILEAGRSPPEGVKKYILPLGILQISRRHFSAQVNAGKGRPSKFSVINLSGNSTLVSWETPKPKAAQSSQAQASQQQAVVKIDETAAALAPLMSQLQAFVSDGEKPSYAAIGDAHGSQAFIDWLDTAQKSADKIVFVGDMMDRGNRNVAVYEALRKLTDDGRLIPLMGNHDLLFIKAMMGDKNAAFSWLCNGGVEVLKEVNFDKTAVQNLEQKIADFNKARQDVLRNPKDSKKRQYLKSLQDDLSMYINGLSANIMSIPKLIEIRDWMKDNFRLYYFDPHGKLYIHAGLPMDKNGRINLEYKGQKGLAALAMMEFDMRKALSSPDAKAEVFSRLDDENGPLWNRNWIGNAQAIDYKDEDTGQEQLDEILDEFGIVALVFGHTRQNETLNIAGRIFGIDRKMYGDEGGILVDEGNGVVINSVYMGKREAQSADRPNVKKNVKALLDKLSETPGQKTQAQAQPQPQQVAGAVQPQAVIDGLDEQERTFIRAMVKAFEAVEAPGQDKEGLLKAAVDIIRNNDSPMLEPDIAAKYLKAREQENRQFFDEARVELFKALNLSGVDKAVRDNYLLNKDSVSRRLANKEEQISAIAKRAPAQQAKQVKLSLDQGDMGQTGILSREELLEEFEKVFGQSLISFFSAIISKEMKEHPFKKDAKGRPVLISRALSLEKGTADMVEELLPLTILRLVIEYKRNNPDFKLGGDQAYDPWNDEIGVDAYPIVLAHELGHLIFTKLIISDSDRQRLGQVGIERFWAGNFGDPKSIPTLNDKESPEVIQEYKNLVGAYSCQKLTNAPLGWANSLNEHFAHNVERLSYGAPFLVSPESKATTDDILNFFIKIGVINKAEADNYRAISSIMNGGKVSSPIVAETSNHISPEFLAEVYLQERILKASQIKGRALSLAEETAVRLNEPDVQEVQGWLEKDPQAVIDLLQFQEASNPIMEARIENEFKLAQLGVGPAKDMAEDRMEQAMARQIEELDRKIEANRALLQNLDADKNNEMLIRFSRLNFAEIQGVLDKITDPNFLRNGGFADEKQAIFFMIYNAISRKAAMRIGGAGLEYEKFEFLWRNLTEEENAKFDRAVSDIYIDTDGRYDFIETLTTFIAQAQSNPQIMAMLSNAKSEIQRVKTELAELEEARQRL